MDRPAVITQLPLLQLLLGLLLQLPTTTTTMMMMVVVDVVVLVVTTARRKRRRSVVPCQQRLYPPSDRFIFLIFLIAAGPRKHASILRFTPGRSTRRGSRVTATATSATGERSTRRTASL